MKRKHSIQFVLHKRTHGKILIIIVSHRFPNEMSKVVYKDEELENEIRLTIKTYLGINTGLGEVPFKVFERVVQNQVDKLTPSVTNAINLVIELLSESVPKCTQHVSSPITPQPTIEF